MKIKLLTILFFGYSFCLISQEKERIEIYGTITNTTDVEGIHVLNRSSRYNAVTDQNGRFFIHAREQDTLVFSSITYSFKSIIVSEEIYINNKVIVTLDPLINELDEVIIGPKLTGNLNSDIKSIKTEDPINFDDVGIPGFKGTPEEKIVPMVPGIGVDIEAVFKHLSGYYKKLKLRRKWEAQNNVAARLINLYGYSFFNEAYHIPSDRIYDFLLFCMETTTLKKDFNNEDYNSVIAILEEKSKEYLIRLSEKKE